MLADRVELAEPLTEIINSQRLTSADVKYIRETILRGWVLSDGDANLLFQFQQICTDIDPSWDKFYLLALTNYFIEALEPVGALDENTCHFILDKLSVDGCLLTDLDVTLIGDLLERATHYPETLTLAGLYTVKMGIVQRKGVLRPPKTSGTALCEAEVTAVRRFINPKSLQSGLYVSDQAARLVFDINEISEEDKNHKRWANLFVDIMLAYCMREAPREESTSAANNNTGSGKSKADRPTSWVSNLTGGWETDAAGARPSEMNAPSHTAVLERPQPATEQDSLGDHAAWLAERLASKSAYSANEDKFLNSLAQQAWIPPALFPILNS